MPASTPTPPFSSAEHAVDALRAAGYAVLQPAALSHLLQRPLAELDDLRPLWQRLPPDAHLKDGGRYRRRRHGCFVVQGDAVEPVPHRAHWQPVQYNALHGGMERWFEPLEPALLAQPVWPALLMALGHVFQAAVDAPRRWFVEAHQFRIDTSDGIGRPTPEGAHRDGVDFVAVLLAGRDRIRGGETRVFEADGPNGQRFTLTEPWTLLLLDDARVVHESTPIQPVAADAGWRDTLVLTYRTGGFQQPPAAAMAA